MTEQECWERIEAARVRQAAESAATHRQNVAAFRHSQECDAKREADERSRWDALFAKKQEQNPRVRPIQPVVRVVDSRE